MKYTSVVSRSFKLQYAKPTLSIGGRTGHILHHITDLHFHFVASLAPSAFPPWPSPHVVAPATHQKQSRYPLQCWPASFSPPYGVYACAETKKDKTTKRHIARFQSQCTLVTHTCNVTACSGNVVRCCISLVLQLRAV